MEQYGNRGYLHENFRFFHLRTPQAPGVEPHYHEFCKVLLFYSGMGSYAVEGQRYRLQPGDVVVLGTHCVHRPELEADCPYERAILFLSGEFLREFSTPDCDLGQVFPQGRGYVLRLPELRRRKLFDLADTLRRELQGEAYGKALAAKAAVLRFLVQLSREQLLSDPQTAQPLMPENRRVLELMTYMDNHLEEALNIDRLAEEFYISKYHMMRLFRRETGTTVYDYLTLRRLLHARELIRQGLPATQACYRSGFGSYSSFTRACNKHFSATPTGRTASLPEALPETE